MSDEVDLARVEACRKHHEAAARSALAAAQANGYRRARLLEEVLDWGDWFSVETTEEAHADRAFLLDCVTRLAEAVEPTEKALDAEQDECATWRMRAEAAQEENARLRAALEGLFSAARAVVERADEQCVCPAGQLGHAFEREPALRWLWTEVTSCESLIAPPPTPETYKPRAGEHCPRCNSPAPHLHPATQHEGEVLKLCPHAFHGPTPPGEER